MLKWSKMNSIPFLFSQSHLKNKENQKFLVSKMNSKKQILVKVENKSPTNSVHLK